MSDDLRTQIARRHGLHPVMGERLKGETPEQLEADAAALAALGGRQEATGHDATLVDLVRTPSKHEELHALLRRVHPEEDA